MGDYIARAIAADGKVRAFAVNSTEICETARAKHDMSPIGAIALGRLLTGAVMMGSMMKNDRDLMTIKIQADGPIKGMTVTANAKGEVKGYVGNPQVMLPLKDGKLDIAGAVGIGVLSVIKDIGLREPYIGDTILVTSEIGDDLTYYFASSEQVPTSVGLGVRMRKDNTVECAGGFIIQMMPGADDALVDRIEKKIKELPSVSEMLEAGLNPEAMLTKILGDEGLEIFDQMPAAYKCNCSRPRMTKGLMSIGRKELKSMIDAGKPIEVTCQFCGERYTFENEDLQLMYQGLERKGE